MIRYTNLDGALRSLDAPKYDVLEFELKEELALYLLHGLQPRGPAREILANSYISAKLAHAAIIREWALATLPAEARDSFPALSTWKGTVPFE